MDDLRLGRTVRAVRVRRGWRQRDVAEVACCSVSTVSRLERGLIEEMSIAVLRRSLAALEIRLDLRPRRRGGDLDRLLDAAHAELATAVIGFLSGFGWACRPEVSFSIFGERGSIDILAWFPATRTLLVIELKTAIADLQELVSSLDRKIRLAPRIAADLGWRPDFVSGWVIVTARHTNRRRVVEHGALIRAAYPVDGRAMRGWVRQPSKPIRALSFWPDSRHGTRRLVSRQAPRGEWPHQRIR
jgi:transcriptional regulator with XRE-family HTH domain